MRRVLAVVALGGALFMATACGTKTDNTAATPTAAASPTKADYSANTKEICGSLEKILTSAGGIETKTSEAVKKAVAGKKTKAEIDKAALAAMKTVLIEWLAPVRAEAAKAQDPEFKAKVIAMADAWDATVNGIAKLDDATKAFDAPEFAAAAGVLDTYCA